MKTKNSVQKTNFKSVAVLAGLVLISFTISAQSSWKQLLAENSFGANKKIGVESQSVIITSNVKQLLWNCYLEEVNKNDFEVSTDIKQLLWDCYMNEAKGNNLDDAWINNEPSLKNTVTTVEDSTLIDYQMVASTLQIKQLIFLLK